MPDADDRHALAAAIAGRAVVIVTANVREFPTAHIRPINVKVIHPDDFFVDVIDLDTGKA